VSPTETSPTETGRIETTTSTKREIEIQIPSEEVSRETDARIQKYQKLARIPGFRQGHAPPSIIRQRFSQDIQNDVIDALVPKYFRKETDRLGLIPISQPRVSDLHAHAGEAMHFKASFEVMPEIKVEGYKELRAEHPEISVTDEEVEQSLKGLQEQKAAFSPVEGRAIADGDYAQASLDGTPKQDEAGTKPVHMDDVLVEIGGKNTMPEFTENLRGVNAGEDPFSSCPQTSSLGRLRRATRAPTGRRFVARPALQALRIHSAGLVQPAVYLSPRALPRAAVHAPCLRGYAGEHLPKSKIRRVLWRNHHSVREESSA